MSQFHVDTLVVERGTSFFHQNQVSLFHPGSGRSASDPSVLMLSSESSLLMAMLLIIADVLHLAKGFALANNEVM